MIKTYYHLAKPGIVYGNVFTTLAAFLFASHWHFALVPFAATMLGIALVIGSACVSNNYLDREIDKKMSRTKERALATGAISTAAALTYAVVLGLFGLFRLYVCVNVLTAGIALLGFVVYVGVYTPLKPRSALAVYVGAIAGAVPIVVGYTAVSNRLDLTALFLFACLFLWQLPHFVGISVYRFEEYTAAGIPLLVTKPTEQQKRTGRTVFLSSLIVLVVFCIALALAPLLL